MLRWVQMVGSRLRAALLGLVVLAVLAGTIDSALTRTSPTARDSAVFKRGKAGRIPVPQRGDITVAAVTIKAKLRKRKRRARSAEVAARRLKKAKLPKLRVRNRARMPKSLRAVLGVVRKRKRNTFTAYVVLVNRGSRAAARAAQPFTSTFDLAVEPVPRGDFAYAFSGRQQLGINVAPLNDKAGDFWAKLAKLMADGNVSPRWSGLYGSGLPIGTPATGELGIFAAGNVPDLRFEQFDRDADLTGVFTSTIPVVNRRPVCVFTGARVPGFLNEAAFKTRCDLPFNFITVDGPGSSTITDWIPPPGASAGLSADHQRITFSGGFAANTQFTSQVRFGTNVVQGDTAIITARRGDGTSFTSTVPIQIPLPPPACNDDVDNDSDGTIDWEHDSSCPDANGTSEAGTLDCANVAGSNQGGAFKVAGSCTGPFKRIDFTLLGGVQLNGAFTVNHTSGSCTNTTTLVSCPNMKEALANPQHLVDAIFGTDSTSAGQQIKLEFYDSAGNKVAERILTRGA